MKLRSAGLTDCVRRFGRVFARNMQNVPHQCGRTDMKLGAFSISLNVQDIQASQVFYGRLGFEAIGGDAAQGWLILRNEACTIGLFKGMIEKNTLTFNPGWNQQAETIEAFQDVRDLQK